MPLSSLHTLLSTCAHAVAEADATIRTIHSTSKEEILKNAVLKIEGDATSVMTEADVSAQHVLVAIIRHHFPEASLVCEEDEDDSSDAALTERLNKLPIALDVSPAFDIPKDWTPEDVRSVELKNVTIFIDPLDGTREFVNGNLDNVQTLVGITYNGKAIAGVVGLPFYTAKSASAATGLTLVGVVGAGLQMFPKNSTLVEDAKESADYAADLAHTVVSATGSILKDPVLRNVAKVIAPGERRTTGGCGNKVLRVVLGKADIALANLGTSLWDTCATEALIKSVGGQMSDLFGGSFPYHQPNTANVTNVLGVLATGPNYQAKSGKTHEQLVEDLRNSGVLLDVLAASPARVSASADLTNYRDTLLHSTNYKSGATDIARDLKGDLMTAAWLGEVTGSPVKSFTAPEESAVRYLQSDAVRLVLSKADGSALRLFYKRVVMKELDHAQQKSRKTPEKLSRDVRSYDVEAKFLDYVCSNELNESLGLRLPKIYATESTYDGGNILNSGYTALMEDLAESGFVQPSEMNDTQTETALRGLGTFHGSFWTKHAASRAHAVQGFVWEEGSYWCVRKHPSGLASKIEPEWARMCNVFGDQIPAWKDMNDLGSRLGKVVASQDFKDITSVTNPANAGCVTLIHGDLKGGNLFFHKDKPDIAAMIDFQWVGMGVPGLDIAYLFAASVATEALSAENEARLLRTYHAALCASCPAAAESYPYETLVRHYEAALLELLILAITYHWERITATPEVFEKRAGKITCNLYTRSIPHATWFVERCEKIVSKFEL